MRTERFNRAYNALIRAYFEGTLAKGTCAACAVGNICADAIGVKLIPGDFANYGDNAQWMWLFHFRPSIENMNRAILLISRTGYSVEEITVIESAFEFGASIAYMRYDEFGEQQILEDQFNGLSAVVDVLCELDNVENTDKALNNEFRNHPKLVVA